MKNLRVRSEIATAVIYTRVSSKDQLQGYSLESQEKVCREFAAKHNLEVLKVFREEGESAKTADRTQLRIMMKYCERNRNKIGKLIIYKVDRLARNNEDYYALKVVFKKYGMAVQSATEPIGNDPSEKLMEGVLSALAEFDNNVRAQRTGEGMRTRLLNGLWTWSAPVGYRNSKDASGMKIIAPDSKYASIIRMIFEEYTKGLSTFKGIAQKATAMDMRSRHGKKISAQLVMKILRNPLYCGRIEHPNWNVSVKGKHEPIVSVELFMKAQQMLNGHTSWKTPRNRANPDFPLRGIRCQSCGGNISGGWTKGRNKLYAYYSCINAECSQRRAITKEDFEKDFTAFLEKMTARPSDLAVAREAVKLAYKSEMKNVLKENERIANEIENLKFRKQKLLDVKIKDLISDEEFKEQNEALGEQIKNLVLSKVNLIHDGLNVEKAIDFAFDLIQNLPSKWKELDVSDLKVLRSILFPENLSYEYPGIKTAEIPIIYKVNRESNSEKDDLVAPRGIEPLFTP